ncbi:glycosyltransferase family 2 protein [Rhizobium sp. DKSPLA3]|uniref:Glycosyltransferase family 2 protein n=1 Tax=Rhizobium quercicola TaxID=2901226 RepID=A0A9X1NR67_9HYPH|nr:glycosyltransferase family A protein [Rhizobium quercicola]MCD7109682.1 glycosyltransferase family 2 protein [Rhizobium quercicola]
MQNVRGNVDGLVNGVLHGWITDDNADPFVIAVEIDGIRSSEVLANGFRMDLAAAGLPECAFEYEVPPHFHDGQMHSICVRYSADNVELGEPIDFVIERQSSKEQVPHNVHSFVSSEVVMSIVIPTFNRAGLIRETAENLLGVVGEHPIELIVVDDGSVDETSDVLMLLQKSFPKLKYEKTGNRGPGMARNTGATMARGDLVVFLGDDTRAVNKHLFQAHFKAHQIDNSPGHAVLGKVIWPDNRFSLPNFTMSLIQGEGQQQFGYRFMKPWQKYSPWCFYTANASVKTTMVDDWMSEGFSDKFTLYGFEDGEFAYRMSKRYPNFGVFYTPSAVVEHHHHYDVAGFLKRQVSCGYMMDVLFKIHPELKNALLGPALADILSAPRSGSEGLLLAQHYSTVVEGLKSWAIIIDKHYGLGSQNWHSDFLNAIFQLAYMDGYLMLQTENPSAQSTAYRHLLEDFRTRMGRSIESEAIGNVPGFGFI